MLVEFGNFKQKNLIFLLFLLEGEARSNLFESMYNRGLSLRMDNKLTCVTTRLGYMLDI